MIEREFINQKTKEFYIKRYIEDKLKRVGVSQIRLKKIPLGEKIIIHTSRPSLIVGSKGANIKDLTRALKKDFKLENPQIEINEVKNIFLDADIVAERIVGSLERFGSARFKGVGHKTMENVMNSGALGVEIIISGKIPGARAKNWRFYRGYLKKCGDISMTGVRKAKKSALLKSGIVGIKVSIMPSDLVLPDHIKILDEPVQIVEEVEIKEPKTKSKKKTSTKKKPSSKKENQTKMAEANVDIEKGKLGKEGATVSENLVVDERNLPEKIEDKVAKVADDVVVGVESVVEKVIEKVRKILPNKETEKFPEGDSKK
jgi:small subunit ribosomal protein S3